MGLSVDRLTVRFGGLVAVADISFRAPRGRITGLIGPNGAGKSTTFNACSGFNHPERGHISIDGIDVTRMSPSRRARLGLGRTFQRMELFGSLSVIENVELGYEGTLAGANPIRQFIGRRADNEAARHRASEAMKLCGIEQLGPRLPSELSTGERRLVELARVCAGPFTLLMLDEPSSGLDKNETSRFGDVIQNLIGTRDLGILLVEHDMSLVLNICQHIYVLDFGKQLFDGSPAEVASSYAVRSAYLGSELS